MVNLNERGRGGKKLHPQIQTLPHNKNTCSYLCLNCISGDMDTGLKLITLSPKYLSESWVLTPDIRGVGRGEFRGFSFNLMIFINHNYVEFETPIQTAIDFYSNDLPNVNVVNEELHRWKSRWLQFQQISVLKHWVNHWSPNPSKHLYPYEALCHTPSQFMLVWKVFFLSLKTEQLFESLTNWGTA